MRGRIHNPKVTGGVIDCPINGKGKVKIEGGCNCVLNSVCRGLKIHAYRNKRGIIRKITWWLGCRPTEDKKH